MKNLMFLFSLLFVLNALADDNDNCEFELYFPNSTIMIQDTAQVIQHDFNVERKTDNNNSRCRSYRIYFNKGQANSYQRRAFGNNGSFINYNLHRLINMAGTLKQFGDAANSNEYLDGDTPDRDTPYTNRLFISAPSISSQNFPRSGTYTDIVQATLYGVRGENHSLGTTKSFLLTFIVANKIDISLVDEGAPFDVSSTSKVLDFGNIQQNDEKGVDLRVVSNTPYQIRLISMNSGKLKHTKGDSISYGLRMNGFPISLNSSTPTSVGSGNETTTAGDRYNMKFKITQSTDNNISGLYQDVLTITAIAN